ncbi:hypothetical protein [Cytophaga aurantiaca]|uniref:hypothetical protein n=1 Tax=Cytophaga aurantiaca TaxID=29530 RepID=UPI00036AD63F|nr:hypothetical protein [Cytophaga aurantiaca]
MNTFKKLIPALVIFIFVLISCNDTKKSQEETTEITKEVIQTDPVATAEVPIVIDTTGIYKLNNAEAETYILGMDRVLSNINKSIDEDDVSKQFEFTREMEALQEKQIPIQSSFNKKDRALFDTYVQQILDRMAAILKRIKPVE